MVTLKIHREQAEYTKYLVATTNFGQRGRFDGNKRNQFIGMLAEVVLGDALGFERPTGGGFDNGVDFVINNKKCDLKCMERKVPSKPHYVNNLVASQTNYDTTHYIFSSLNSKKWELEILGVIEKKDLEKYFIEKGTTRYRDDKTMFTIEEDMYEIPNSDLNEIYSLDDIEKS